MDTSKRYINMCKEAQEIQELRPKFHLGDYMADDRAFALFRDIEPVPRGNFVFIPRQDQLQEILPPFSEHDVVNWDFYFFANDGISNYLDYFTSMEQYWLAFVMRYKFNKDWNGETWQTND